MRARTSHVAYVPPKLVVSAYVAAIAAAEAYLSFVDAVGGAIAYALLLIVMVNHSALGRADGASRALRGRTPADPADVVTALALVPVMRLVSVSVPLESAREAYQYLVIAGPLLAGLAWAKWRIGLPGVSFRLRSLPLQLGVAAYGVPLGLVAYAVLRPEATVEGTRWTQLTAGVLAVALFAVVEELIFRGFIQEAFSWLYGSSAPLWSAGVYVISYVGAQSAELLALVALLGLLYGWVVQRTGSLLGVTISHSLVNVLLIVVLPQ